MRYTIAFFALVLAACSSPVEPEPEPAKVYDVMLYYTGIGGNVSGNFAVIAKLSNCGNVPVSVGSATYIVKGSLGYALVDVTKTKDTLVLQQTIAPGSVLPFEIHGYSAAYVPYQFDVTFNLVYGDGTTQARTFTCPLELVNAAPGLDKTEK